MSDLFAQADALFKAHQFAQAERLYLKFLATHPNDALAQYAVGRCQALQADSPSKLDAAIASYHRATTLAPSLAAIWISLGKAYMRKADPAKAAAAFDRAVALQPNDPLLLNMFGLAVMETDQRQNAVAIFQRALDLTPDTPHLVYNLAGILHKLNRFDPAQALYEKLVVLTPQDPEAWYSLGTNLTKLGRADEAVAAELRALQLRPDYPDAHNILGIAYHLLGQYDLALQHTRSALAANANFPEAHSNLSFLHLIQGDLQAGWPGFEHRLQISKTASVLDSIPVPRLTDITTQDIAGKTIFIHQEQGLGDAIFSARYIPLLAQRGAHVILQTRPPLWQLFQTIPSSPQLHPSDDPRPAFDLHLPTMSLPSAFNTSLDSIPQNIPYLFPDPIKAAHWQRRLNAYAPSTKIGLVWAGNPEHSNDLHRSLPLSALAPFAALTHHTFFSLQKGPPAEQLASAPFPLINLAPDLADFSDTAAVMANLDLIISVDSSPAHLAGALGRPVWILLPHAPDWRWLLHRPDSPWYPTMRLFRQPAANQWPTLISQLVAALQGGNSL